MRNISGASELLVAPSHISFDKLSICVWAYSTAWNMEVHNAAIEPGFTVLVTGASGSIGLAAIQIARLRGASQVIAVTGSPSKSAQLKEFGADVVIDFRTEDVPQRVRKLTDSRGVDLVLDCVGDLFVAGLRALRNCGRIVNISQLGGQNICFNLRELFPRGISIHGTRGSTRAARNMSCSCWPTAASIPCFIPYCRCPKRRKAIASSKPRRQSGASFWRRNLSD